MLKKVQMPAANPAGSLKPFDAFVSTTELYPDIIQTLKVVAVFDGNNFLSLSEPFLVTVDTEDIDSVEDYDDGESVQEGKE